MKACPFCAEEIQDAAIVCKHCARDIAPAAVAPVTLTAKTAMSSKRLALGIFGLVAVLWIMASLMPTPAPNPAIEAAHAANAQNDSEAKAKRDTLIRQSIEAGLLQKVSCIGSNEAHVALTGWMALDATEKKGFTITMAARCNDEGQGDRIAMIDARSGRTLATYRAGAYTVQ